MKIKWVQSFSVNILTGIVEINMYYIIIMIRHTRSTKIAARFLHENSVRSSIGVEDSFTEHCKDICIVKQFTLYGSTKMMLFPCLTNSSIERKREAITGLPEAMYCSNLPGERYSFIGSGD